eukprot:2104803-Rhodomonas_salina.1
MKQVTRKNFDRPLIHVPSQLHQVRILIEKILHLLHETSAARNIDVKTQIARRQHRLRDLCLQKLQQGGRNVLDAPVRRAAVKRAGFRVHRLAR